MLLVATSVAFLVPALAGPQAQPRPSFFGLTLGANLGGMPECPHINGFLTSVAGDLIRVMCWQNPRARSVPNDGTVYIYFPMTQTPPFLAREGVSVTLRGGAVDKIVVNTKGLVVQDDLLRLLTGKFGKPSTIETRTPQTVLGGRLSIIEAEWVRPLRDHVFFGGAYNNVETGAIVAMTDRALQEQKAFAASHAAPAL